MWRRQLVWAHRFRISDRRWGVRVGMAKMISVTGVFGRIVSRSSMGPLMGTPWIIFPILSGASSTRQQGA